MSRRGLSIVEILVMVVMASALLVPVLSLSSRNVDGSQELVERALVQSLCLDVVDRFKAYRPSWALPGEAAQEPGDRDGPPVTDMFLPIELDVDEMTLFDRAYLEQLEAMSMQPQPRFALVPEAGSPGLFRLDVSVTWKSSRGQAQRFEISRLCYRP